MNQHYLLPDYVTLNQFKLFYDQIKQSLHAFPHLMYFISYANLAASHVYSVKGWILLINRIEYNVHAITLIELLPECMSWDY